METTTETSPAPVDHLAPWMRAAYGRAGSVTGMYKRLTFTPEGEGRVMQIAGWLMGLCHSGRRAEAEKIAEDISSQFEYLNGYGGDEEATFEDGTPVPNVPRYLVQLGDDGTFGGFTVAWYRAVREGTHLDGDRRSMLRNRWDDLVTHPRWAPNRSEPREVVKHYFHFTMNGGLLYHGPGGGETFSVTVGTPRFWSIHT